jgi:hypothetical protein
MKNNILKIVFLLTLSFNSCDKAELTQDEITKANKTSSQEAMRQSSMFDYIESINVDNGLNTECENNILIFPSWEKYHLTIEKLDELTENYCDAFDANVPANISDEEYDALCESAGFDEDNILRQFEEDLAFCSLRQKIEAEETAWLDLQGDGDWNADEDPDNDFIDEESERALLSHGHEVIIGSKERGYTIYKFYDDMGSYITINGLNLETLNAINNGTPASSLPNVTTYTPPRPNGKCKDKVKEVKYEWNNDNRIKRISKVRPAIGSSSNSDYQTNNSIFPSKIKAKTVGYKKNRRGKWKKKRTWIVAAINAENHTVGGIGFIDCDLATEPIFEEKNKRRKKVKVKKTSVTTIATVGSPNRFNFTLNDNKLYSRHQQGTIFINKDYYDMPEN